MHEGGNATLLPGGRSDIAVAAAVDACLRAEAVEPALALCEEILATAGGDCGDGSPVIQGAMVTLAWCVGKGESSMRGALTAFG